MIKNIGEHQSCCTFYFFGLIGSAIYFISKATTFGAGVIGSLKAIVWPAYLIHGLFNHYSL